MIREHGEKRVGNRLLKPSEGKKRKDNCENLVPQGTS